MASARIAIIRAAVMRFVINAIVNWRTTTTVGGGSVIGVGKTIGYRTPTGAIDWISLALAILGVLAGAFMKDGAVTGHATTAPTPTPTPTPTTYK